jgi:hypothetical protein
MTVRTCLPDVPSVIVHRVPLPACCPVSGNPLAGSTLTMAYLPTGRVFPVEWLEDLIREYVGGHASRNIRNMEEMVQDLAKRAAAITLVPVRVRADLRINPPQGGTVQDLHMTARGRP